MSEIIKIQDKDILLKEYDGERVVTSWDIALVHSKNVGDINKIFYRNINKFIENEDYFLLSREIFSERFKAIQNFIPNNVKEIPIFTESGYLLLAKAFNDDLSWEIQRLLIKSYFTLKQIQSMNIKENYLLNILKANNDLERAVAINEYEVGYVKPLEYKGEYVDRVLSSETLLTTTQIAKDFGLSAIKLNKTLHEQGVQYKQSNQWLLYAKYLQEGLCQSNTYLCEDGEARFLTKWTQKGKMFIYNLLKEKYGLLPISQWEK